MRSVNHDHVNLTVSKDLCGLNHRISEGCPLATFLISELSRTERLKFRQFRLTLSGASSTGGVIFEQLYKFALRYISCHFGRTNCGRMISVNRD